jgi:hypothetical protein
MERAMSNWTTALKSAGEAAKRAAPRIARATGALGIAAGVWSVWIGAVRKFGIPIVEGGLMIILGIGVVWLRPTALRIATVVLVIAAIGLPIGMLNPFAAMDLPHNRVQAPGFEGRWIASIIALAAGAIILAHFLGLARIQILSKKASRSMADAKSGQR